MIVAGLVLLLVGLLVAGLHVLFVIGLVLLIVGCVLAVAGGSGHSIGGRRHYW